MQTSTRGLEAIKQFEGLRLKAYQCSAGIWTIGYGHTAGVKRGMVITKAQAEAFLLADIARFESGVLKLTAPRQLTQGQFDALVSFAFNTGLAALEGSTLLRKIKAGAPDSEIVTQFSRWVYAAGRRLPGLVSRRAWEAKSWRGAL